MTPAASAAAFSAGAPPSTRHLRAPSSSAGRRGRSAPPRRRARRRRRGVDGVNVGTQSDRHGFTITGPSDTRPTPARRSLDQGRVTEPRISAASQSPSRGYLLGLVGVAGGRLVVDPVHVARAPQVAVVDELAAQKATSGWAWRRMSLTSLGVPAPGFEAPQGARAGRRPAPCAWPGSSGAAHRRRTCARCARGRRRRVRARRQGDARRRGGHG